MSSGCELARESDVAADVPLVGVESLEKIRVSGDSPGEQRVDGSTGCAVGGVDGTKCVMTWTVGSEETRVSPELNRGESEVKFEDRVLDGEVIDLDWNGGIDGCAVGNVEAGKVGYEEVRVPLDIDSGEIDGKADAVVSVVKAENLPLSVADDGFAVQNIGMEHGVSVAKAEDLPFSVDDDGFAIRNTGMEHGVSGIKAADLQFSVGDDAFAVQNTGLEHLMMRPEEVARFSSAETKGDAEIKDEQTASDSDSSYSKIDEGAGTEMPEGLGPLGAEAVRALSYGFEKGDMVWGKVKSHPWWPGHIFSEAFASPAVRRSRREGHVLVAFFGDSSYGWFDPAELIPFEPHYAEKSGQTNSRNFIKAVEEAVDEACRRRALGLTCYCRNPFNFRPTNVQGYFAVDVGGYEPSGVYSTKQIRKARDSFQSADTLSFIQKLALMPRNSEQRGIDWIYNMATVLAYRKAVFEEFDETYAQAFGMQPVRPSRNSMGVLDQPAKVPSRAPLSGPLVIAEALGERKSSAKPIKVKDQSKKDKYMFKRREELNDPRARYISHGQAGILVPSAFEEGTTPSSAGNYVLQKRIPVVSKKTRDPRKVVVKTTSGVGAAPSRDGNGQEASDVDKRPVVDKYSLVGAQVNRSQVILPARSSVSLPMSQPPVDHGFPAVQGGPEDVKPPLDKEMFAFQEMKGKVRSDVMVHPMSASMHGSKSSPAIADSFEQTFWQEGETIVDSKQECVTLPNKFEGLKQSKMRLPSPVEDHHGLDQVQEGGSCTPPLSIDAKLPGKVVGMGIDSLVKKAKVPKRPGEDMSSEKFITGDKKKKKKKESGLDTSLDHPQKRLKTVKDGESVRKSAGKSIGIGLVPRENSQMDPPRKVDGSGSTFSSSSLLALPLVDLGNIEVELPQLVDDLLALALDPFHGVERNSPAIVCQVFLQFRSLVYQKSLVLTPPTEAETSDLNDNKSPTITCAGDIPPSKDVRDHPSALRPPKQPFRQDDPTKGARKRSLSDRQEDLSAKRLKKLNELKSVAAEKKTGSMKTTEMQQGEQKNMSMSVSGKGTIKPESVKRLEQPARMMEPTMLIMKFPPRTALPSIPELKARFARFGPLDHSATRVYWKSYTCRIVFKHKSHAQAAHNYAVRNTSLFGHLKVKYLLRDLEALPDSGKRQRAEDAFDEIARSRPPGMSDSAGEPRQRGPLQSALQLKSCLKKSSGDEPGPIMGVPRESPRVKFMLGGEESSREEQLMVSSSNNNGSDADGGASSLAMDFNSKNFHEFIPPLPPLIPLPPRIPDVHESRGIGLFPPKSHNMHYSKVVEPRNNPNYIIDNYNNNIDISHQMLSLLVRCSEIVNDVKSLLGYVPYHPL